MLDVEQRERVTGCEVRRITRIVVMPSKVLNIPLGANTIGALDEFAEFALPRSSMRRPAVLKHRR